MKPARRTVERSYSREQTFASVRLPATERPYFTPGFPLALPLRHGSRIRSLSGPPTATFGTGDATASIVSDTGELTWSVTPERKGRVVIDTDRTQALIGHSTVTPRRLKHLDAQLDNDFAAVVLTSLDGQPISMTERMLLTVGARVANTGMVWNDARTTLAQWGEGPSLIEVVTGTVVIRNLSPARNVRTTALDGAGRALGEPAAGRRVQDGWAIPIGGVATTWYEIEVTRRPHTSSR